MRKYFPASATAAIAAILLAGAATASDRSVALTDQNVAAVRAKLAEQGYEVGKVKLEDGYYEAYARKDGRKIEVYLDGDYKIVRTEDKD